MEWRRLKNIIILILLLLNGFLLVLVGARRGEAIRYDRAALDRTVEVLAGRGIQVDPDTLAPAGSLLPLTVERDLDAEQKLAQALLGSEARADNRGGGLYLYQSDLGELSLRAGGEFSAELAENPRWSADQPRDHAAALMQSMGVDAAWIGTDAQGGGTVVRFRQLWDGIPVFSCEVRLVYEGGLLRAIQGTLLTGGQAGEEPGEILTLPTALMRFLDGVTAAGDVCSSIRSMEAGYRIAAQPLSGGVRLTAVWLVTSDTASYYLDGATGELTRLTEP